MNRKKRDWLQRTIAIPRLASLVILAMATEVLASGNNIIDFSRDVLPILSDNCFQCHGPEPNEGRKGDLRLDDEADVTRDRGGYQAIAAGDPQTSELYQRIAADDPDVRMPPAELGRQLTPEQIETIRRWIEQGAKWGRHWALERVERPAIDDPQRHPIDVLVQRRLAEEGITPNPRASRNTLIRRLTLDLTGLPPTPKQLDTFLADTEPGAWERLVDRTLASPAFGQRMAWDWLEAARYADSNGYQGDGERTMWPWRDWVVRAFNENLPWDQFTIWQLAGDLLPNATHDQILATGFNRNHMINGEGGRIPEENRVDYVLDMTETMGTVWLGLTLNCCRCHDHKFDPLKQREYYQLTAFFNQTPVDGGGGNPQTPPVLEVPEPVQQEALHEAESAWQKTWADVDEEEARLGLKRLLRDSASLENADSESRPTVGDLPDPVREALGKTPGSRSRKDWDQLRQHFEKSDPAYASLLNAAKEAKQRLDQARAAIPKVMVMQDREQRRPTYMLDRGLYNQPGEEVVAGLPAALPPLPEPDNADRLDLARWLVSRDHPLTARVAVNRFWQMLFGIGLVKTAEDFGVQGEYPVQRELLDWLAAEFMESGWDVKHVLRAIVTSETYQRSSSVTSPAGYQRDPDNRFLARGPRFRLPSWMIRDQALAAAGLLNRQIGGKAAFPYQPEGVWGEATFGNKRYEVDNGPALYRRSLYTFWRRIVGPTLYFDSAKRQVCEVKPLRTNTPMHALTTLNDTTYVEAARVLAEKLLGEASDDDTRMRLAGRRVLSREPSVRELDIWRRSLERAAVSFKADPEAASRFVSHGASTPDASLPPETHAAWTSLCLNLLNLDETLTKE